jgi:hypothetical protein
LREPGVISLLINAYSCLLKVVLQKITKFIPNH